MNCSNVSILNATRSTEERVVRHWTLDGGGGRSRTLVNITVPAAAFNGSIAGSGAFGTLGGASVTLSGTFHDESPVARIAWLAGNVAATVLTSNVVSVTSGAGDLVVLTEWRRMSAQLKKLAALQLERRRPDWNERVHGGTLGRAAQRCAPDYRIR